MRLQITDTEAEYYASVLDDNGDVLVPYCSADTSNFFYHNNDLYVVLPPNFTGSKDWKIYKLTQ